MKAAASQSRGTILDPSPAADDGHRLREDRTRPRPQCAIRFVLRVDVKDAKQVSGEPTVKPWTAHGLRQCRSRCILLELTFPVERSPVVQAPVIFPVGPAQPVLQLKAATSVKRKRVNGKAGVWLTAYITSRAMPARSLRLRYFGAILTRESGFLWRH